jgi:hypothetical protein
VQLKKGPSHVDPDEMGQADWTGLLGLTTSDPFFSYFFLISINAYFLFLKKLNYIYINTSSLFYFV